jgi:hypothetical protein
VLSVLAAVPMSAQSPSEATLKAAVVSKFPQFIEWPAPALAGRRTLDLCVAPPDPFGDLQELVAGVTVDGRGMAVRRVDDERSLDGCAVFYLSTVALATHRALLQHAAMLPILTVGDDSRFLDEGGDIQLKIVAGRVRFEVNAAAASRVGLKISSQLLQLALAVRGGA